MKYLVPDSFITWSSDHLCWRQIYLTAGNTLSIGSCHRKITESTRIFPKFPTWHRKTSTLCKQGRVDFWKLKKLSEVLKNILVSNVLLGCLAFKENEFCRFWNFSAQRFWISFAVCILCGGYKIFSKKIRTIDHRRRKILGRSAIMLFEKFWDYIARKGLKNCRVCRAEN